MAKGYLVYGKSKKGAKRYLSDKKGTTVPVSTKAEAEKMKKVLRKAIKKKKLKAGWKVYSKKV